MASYLIGTDVYFEVSDEALSYPYCEQSVLRTETIGCLITIIFSVIQLIASGRETILSRSNYIASLLDSIVSEAKLIMFTPEMIASKLEIILSTTTKTA